ncbi:MAG: hypothetical protein NVS2B7_27170 [Herpetosiphon sp.]
MKHEVATPPWFVLSIRAGNMIQLGGLLAGSVLVVRAARVRGAASVRLLSGGWVIIYFCSHAIGHCLVGQLGGIRFIGYGVHGTTAPYWYPPGVRWIFQHLPLLSARTEPISLRAAKPAARMAMYVAGPLLTLITGLGIPLYARAARIAGAHVLLIAASLWFTPMIMVEVLRERGDLHRAGRELRGIMARTIGVPDR